MTWARRVTSLSLSASFRTRLSRSSREMGRERPRVRRRARVGSGPMSPRGWPDAGIDEGGRYGASDARAVARRAADPMSFTLLRARVDLARGEERRELGESRSTRVLVTDRLEQRRSASGPLPRAASARACSPAVFGLDTTRVLAGEATGALRLGSDARTSAATTRARSTGPSMSVAARRPTRACSALRPAANTISAEGRADGSALATAAASAPSRCSSSSCGATAASALAGPSPVSCGTSLSRSAESGADRRGRRNRQ